MDDFPAVLFHGDKGFDRYIGVACGQRYTREIGLNLDAAQYRQSAAAGYRFGYMLNGFIQILFGNGQFHDFTPVVLK
ncbi:hypothetical protein D3C87_2012120 [compost metagenome]